ncbi:MULTISPECIES: hypothetical protein [unclassified Streptomyces]|uniref:hypothetical protein n=1 Tax=unclassified Streptomyces TaxID=2593676 RepID=UPI0020257486|nr:MULTISPECIES: hypothetical protein [unclassified Streptomyces]WSC20372.1 hypothetical protein OIE60_12135 [Streptomyces sp. NBC_01766]
MAVANFNAAPSASAHPQAKPGYGKRSAPDQAPRRKGDFAHLPPREAYLAAYIDRLPEGAAMDVKTLAKAQPQYGQQAVAAALNALSAAGHLRRIRRSVGEGRTQWVQRTAFSRTAREDSWWARFLDGDVPQPDVVPARSGAYEALASLGRADVRLVLSAGECGALEEQAGVWLARDGDRGRFVRALTAGLPSEVHAAGAFVRQRLTDKMPPERMPTAPGARSGWVMECTNCGRPGAPDALPGGICAECRSLPPEEVHRRVATLREAGGLRSARTAGGESRAGVRSAQVSALRRRSGVNR